MEVIGTRRKAFHHKVQQPQETDTYRTTDPARRDALAQQVFTQRALLVSNDVVFRAGHKLASARFTDDSVCRCEYDHLSGSGSIDTLGTHLSRP
jgi:hypothetical protein